MPLDPSTSWSWVALALCVSLAVAWEAKTRRRRLHLPPGPPCVPVLGNALDLPRRHLGLEFQQISDKYGDVVYLDALGQPILLVNSVKVAHELLDKRSANYSDRPMSVMAELTGFGCMFMVHKYGNRWRLHRRVFHQSFNSDAVVEYRPIHAAPPAACSPRSSPHRESSSARSNCAYPYCAQCTSASPLMRVAYGVDLEEPNDRYFQVVERVSAVGEEISVPGRFPVEGLPSLRYIPEWFPGGAFKRWSAEAKRYFQESVNTLYAVAVDGLHKGTTKESFVTRLLEDVSSYDLEGGDEPDLEAFIKSVAISIYAAGSDTVNLLLHAAFFLAMAMFPDVQRKAQAELDRVVGRDRLPDFSDADDLPYLRALLTELARWHIVTPISSPHSAIADDEFNGHFIPKGTVIIVNIWSLARDPELYPDPDADPTEIAFGFGRRICPGRYFAEASLWVVIASVLHTFTISPPVDADGKPVALEHDTATRGVVAHPGFHDYVVKPRDAQAEQLIHDTRNEA
ncbi:cytochrome P450 98A3 [Epithele typhae]|uniref:cytochrome P450 98A3 n=1 Tax=Epithele typhae TaxID=378194 RepID=UPI002008A837|nr:cytochrome P450 98A3 [Epithele typhae]KAH9926307.1 cytochrome P450 98A3 [Epithele typhae]